MTNAIWLLYLADVVGSISVALAFAGIASLATAGLARMHAAMEDHDPPRVRQYLVATAIFWGVASLTPSKVTLYAVAATEIGETPTGSKAVRALNAWLDRQIEGEEQSQ